MPRELPWKLELEDIRAYSASPLSLVYIYSWIAGLGDCTNRRKKINSADQSWTLAFALSRRRGSLSTVAFARQPDTECAVSRALAGSTCIADSEMIECSLLDPWI